MTDNIKSITHAFSNLEHTTHDLPATIKDIRGLIADLHETSDEFRLTAASVRGVTDKAGPQLSEAMDHIATVTAHLSDATDNLNQLIRENRGDIRGFTRESLPQVERLLGDSRAAVTEVRDLAHSLRENPSQLLFEKSGPGSRHSAMSRQPCLLHLRAARADRLLGPVAQHRPGGAAVCAAVASRPAQRRAARRGRPRRRCASTGRWRVAGLNTDRIALLRPGNRLDYYAGSRWSAPLTELVSDLERAVFRSDTLLSRGGR